MFNLFDPIHTHHPKPVKKIHTEQGIEVVGLDGSILTLFIICWIGMFRAGVVFIVEDRNKMYDLIRQVGQSIGHKLSNVHLNIS